jgi:hypothetical protein
MTRNVDTKAKTERRYAIKCPGYSGKVTDKHKPPHIYWVKSFGGASSQPSEYCPDCLHLYELDKSN